MERLTFRHDCPGSNFHGRAEPCEPINCLDGYSKKALDDVVNRLAAYEETGLEPDDCMKYKKFEDILVESGVPFSRIIELVRVRAEQQTNKRLTLPTPNFTIPVPAPPTKKPPLLRGGGLKQDYKLGNADVDGP